MRSFRRKPERPQTYAERLADQYARGTISFEAFEAHIEELLEAGIADQRASTFDAAMKEMYRGPIRDIPTAPTIYRSS